MKAGQKPPRLTRGLEVEVRQGPGHVTVEEQEAFAASYLRHLLAEDGLPNLTTDDHEAA